MNLYMRRNILYNLTIKTIKKGDILLGFENLHQIAHVLGIQTGVFFGYVNADDLDQFLSVVSSNLSKRFREREMLGVFDDLNENSVIVDIGAGTGWFDIAMSKYIDGGKFIMVDKQEWTYGYAATQWDRNYEFYNDWGVFDDLVSNSNVARDRFVQITPEDEWPEHIDLIFSGFSYLWHYPKDTYWDRIEPTGASLCFDVLNKENSMEEINQDLSIECDYIKKPEILFHWFWDTLELDEDGSPGKCCYWRR